MKNLPIILSCISTCNKWDLDFGNEKQPWTLFVSSLQLAAASLFKTDIYRPQTMFGERWCLHLSVSHSVHEGCLPRRECTPPRQIPPWADTPWADTSLGRHPLLCRQPPWADTPVGRHSPPGRHPLGRHPPPHGQTPPRQTPPLNAFLFIRLSIVIHRSKLNIHS